MKKNLTNQIYRHFLLGGVLLIAFGLLHLYGFFQSNEAIKLYDGIFNVSCGVLISPGYTVPVA